MTDADTIRRAWGKAPPWDFNQFPVLRLSGPANLGAAHIRFGDAPIGPVVPVIEFRRERRAQPDGLEFWRIIGRFHDTEICVAQRPCDFD